RPGSGKTSGIAAASDSSPAKRPELWLRGTGGPRRQNIPGDSGARGGNASRSHCDGSTRPERPRPRSFWIDYATGHSIGPMARSGRADLRSPAKLYPNGKDGGWRVLVPKPSMLASSIQEITAFRG